MAKKKETLPPWRPREHDRDQIASELIEWAKQEDSINLCGFCVTREHPIAPSKISLWAKECENFRQALEIARAYLGSRRERLLNSEMLHVKGYDLNATTYDPFLKEEKMFISQYETNLRKEEDKKPTEINIRVAHDGLGSGLSVSTEKVSNPVHKGAKQRN
jgi:hypothetical protein